MSDEAILRYAQGLRDQEERGRANLVVVGGNPDAAGRANALARATNLPADVVDRNMDEVQRRAQVETMRRLTDRYPAIGKWAADPRNAAVGRDDLDNLGVVGRVYDGVKKTAQALVSGVPRATAGIYGALRMMSENSVAYNPLTWAEKAIFGTSMAEQVGGFATAQQAEGNRLADATAPRVKNFVGKNLLAGVSSLPTTATAVAASFAGGPTLGLSVAGTVQGGQSFGEARDKGLSPLRSTTFAASQGLIEVATEKIPLIRLLGDIANKTPFAKTLARQLAAEIPQEQAATLLQDLNDWAVLNPEKPFSEYVKERPAAALETALATAAGAVGNASIAKSFETAVAATGKIAERAGRAAQAKDEVGFLDELGRRAAESKTRQRDPEAFEVLLTALGSDAEVENVFIPADKVREYLQSSDWAKNDFWNAFDKDISEAEATGGDVVIPVAKVAAHLAGTPAWDALRDDMRLSPGGMSLNEAKAFDDAKADEIAKMGETLQAQDDAARVAQEPRQKLFESVQSKLTDAGFTVPVARTQAELIAARYATRAERMGQTLTGNEFDDIEVNQVLPESLRPVMAADQLSVVANAMRRGRDPKAANGPSLLEWIASKGGIEDRGGDLASMGADKWHRGKPGKRRLVRPHIEGQMSMLGTDGQQNSNSPDELALRAWEAGYFPEFTERPSVNDLLEAISEGVAGRDRFAEDRSGTTEDVRMAAQDLYQLLDSQGVDPLKATDKEIRQTVERYQAEVSEGQGFDQSPSDIRRWQRSVDAIIRGDRVGAGPVKLGMTPSVLQLLGFPAGDLVMMKSKIALARKDHPEVPLSIWHDLPNLISDPRAVIPSRKGDGSVVVAIEGRDRDDRPIIVPIIASTGGNGTTILSVYGKVDGDAFIATDIRAAQKSGAPLYVRNGLADTLVAPLEQPGDAASHAPVASEVSAKPARKILSLADVVKKRFDQSYSDGPRGRVTFQTGKSVIDLFQQRDLSTFLHESGHIWLEELRTDAESADASDQLKADWQTVQGWFKANGHPLKKGVIPVDAHELWARGVERFMMEGKAPTSALRKAFDAFRSWLMSIYQVVDNLRAPVSPEVRDVMARLIATDAEIAQAAQDQNIEALFTDAAQAGMTQAEFDAYRTAATEARGEAHDALLFRTMAVIRKARTREYKDQAAAVRADVTGLVDSRPEFRAIKLLRSKGGPKIDRAWLVETFGADAVSMLPKGVPSIVAENGMPADMVAEMSGFPTGDAMVRALMGVEARKRQMKEGGDLRSVRESVIEEEVTAIMRERHGDPLNDGSIEEEALAAIHNDRQGEVIASELRALSRRTGDAPTPYKLARQWAARKVAEGTVRDVASRSAIQRYARAAAKAGKLAQEAMLKQDAAETFRQKQAQMLNNALIAEASKAAEAIDSAVDRLGRIAKRATMKAVDQDYLDQAHGLLEQVDLRNRSQASIDRQLSFEEWAVARNDEGFDVVVPASFAATLGTTHWSRLSVENLIGLDDAVKQVIHLGKLKQTLLDGQDQREFDAIVAEAVDAAGGLRQKPPSDLMEPSRWDSIKSGIASIDAALLKMETVFDWLDGGPLGVFNRVVFRRIADAQDREKAMTADYITRLVDHLKALPKDQLARWAEKVEAPELLNRETGRPWVLTRDQLVSMALNMGNEGNVQRLTDGYGWTEEGVRAVLDRELSAADWQYVQNVWDTLETLWPEIAAMERRINGVEPDRVVSKAFETPHGMVRGGYFPAVYDPRKSVEAESNAARNGDIFENIYTRATTRASATKNRADRVKRPIHLSLGVINRHVMEVIHDITHREAIMDADRFLSNKRVMKAVDDSLGPEVRKQFRPWLQHIANEHAIDRRGVAGWDGFAKRLRTNTSIVGMGFRISTIVMQVAGYSNSFERVGAKWIAPQLVKAFDPRAWSFVLEHSAEVRNRMETMERDIRENVKATLGKRDILSEARRFAFHGIGYMDRAVVIPTWLGAYNRGVSEGMSDADAGYFADKAVRQSQGAGAAKDLAAVQRSNEWMRLATMFYSYQAAVYQRFRSLGRDAAVARTQDLPDLIARSFWLVIVPPLLAELLAGRGPGDDEDWGMWSFQQMLLGLLGPIPIARDVANSLESGFGYSFTPAARAFETGQNVVKDLKKLGEGEDTKRATRNALELSGYTLGIPTGQLASAVQFIVDVSEGEQDPDSVGDWWEGLTKGKIKDD